MNDDLLNDKLDRHEKKIEEFDNRLDRLEQQRKYLHGTNKVITFANVNE